MERISDEKLDALLAEGYKGEDVSKDGHVLTMMLLQELKERRAVDKPLDIKAQMRLAQDRCPDVWDALNSTAKALNYAIEALGGGRNE